MSAGSGASNLGYGDVYPNSNVNPAFVNISGSTYAGGFGSNEIPKSSHSMVGASNNVEAASGNWVGGGGRSRSRRNSRRRKNISRIYKMRSTKQRSMKRGAIRNRRYRASYKRGGSRHMRMRRSRKYARRPVRRMRRTRRQRGGEYAQYESNVPYTPGYSLAGPLSPDLSAMANPPIYERYNHCQDNYNHYNATQNS